MKRSNKRIYLLLMLFYSSISLSAISIDRTRVIFNGDESSMSISVYNRNAEKPYLAQAWLESLAKEKIDKPFIVTPPIQRIDANEKSQIQIEALPSVKLLPQDRESAFYFNVREIPPKPTKANTLQLALQTQVKLFYRPEKIVVTSTELTNNPWQEKLLVLKKSDGIHLDNPTPYYITILDISSKKNKMEDIPMVAPFSSIPLHYNKDNFSNDLILTYINDFGGRIKMKYTCNQYECSVKK
ncbi:fimbria/pilus periplasmic chaperone [Providencia huaxiensis]|uniref:fimbria/pilus periplasmic chaperone n=1 Tax=Providencia huaxiensis TaxID=2027290 RepID=UPI003757D68D